MNYGTYCDLGRFKRAVALGIDDVADDADLLLALEDASRWIDDYCRRAFYGTLETRYFTATCPQGFFVPDLLNVTSLKTDGDGDRTYETTWASTDYDLEPFNRLPRWLISLAPSGRYSFPTGSRGVEITGLWGYGSADADGQGGSITPYETSGISTAEVLDISETDIDVTSGPALSPGQVIVIESEQMYIRSITANVLTVTRGVNGSTAATHATGKAISIWQYPRPISAACLEIANRFHKLPSAPFGVIGQGDMGTSFIGRAIPDIERKLDAYRNMGMV